MSNSLIIDGEACALDDLPKAILSLLIFVYSTDPDDRIKRRALEVGSRPNDRRRPHETE